MKHLSIKNEELLTVISFDLEAINLKYGNSKDNIYHYKLARDNLRDLLYKLKLEVIKD